MLAATIVVLCIALVIITAKWLLLRREVATLARDIGQIVPGETNRQLRVATQDAQVAALANAVNRLYDEVDQICAQQTRAGDELRQNMADISHDLRTPLTSILGYLGLLGKDDNSPAQQQEYLRIATEKAEALRHMVDSLFELARLEAGAYHLQQVKLDAVELLAQEIAACYVPFSATGQQPEIELAPTLPILADKLALQRVFANLLQNILRHGESGIRICAEEQAGRAVFSFANRAPQLVGSNVGRLFERSYTGDVSRGNKNTGLGLAITREFTHQMGGEIDARMEGDLLVVTLHWPLAG